MDKEKPKADSEKVEVKTPPKKEEVNLEESVILSQEEFNGVKLQLAKAINDYKELEQDFEKYRKRTVENMVGERELGKKEAIEAIFPALDTFKKAKALVADKASLSGIQLIEKSLMASLEKLGVKPIEAVGKKFDQNLHSAVVTMPSDKESGTVIEELETGYTLGDKVIKFSQVVVAK